MLLDGETVLLLKVPRESNLWVSAMDDLVGTTDIVAYSIDNDCLLEGCDLFYPITSVRRLSEVNT